MIFNGLSAWTWSPDEGHSAEGSYNADGYVFAVLTATDHTQYDVLDADQWSFWVLPRHVVIATGQRSMRLSRVEALAGPPVPYVQLAARVREVGAAAGSHGPAGDPRPAPGGGRGRAHRLTEIPLTRRDRCA